MEFVFDDTIIPVHASRSVNKPIADLIQAVEGLKEWPEAHLTWFANPDCLMIVMERLGVTYMMSLDIKVMGRESKEEHNFLVDMNTLKAALTKATKEIVSQE